MKSIARIILALLSAVSMTGCASSGSWADRGRDAMDIFTLSAGTGTGFRARVGPLGTGLLMDSTVAGWRGGEWLGKESYVNKGKPVPWNHDIQLGVVGEEDFMGGFLCLDRGKAFSSRMLCGLNVPTRKSFRKEGLAMSETLKKPTPHPARYSPMPYLTQIEVVLGLGVSIRVGFNPGELLDFLLGWVGIDIFADDLGAAGDDAGRQSDNSPPPRQTPGGKTETQAISPRSDRTDQ